MKLTRREFIEKSAQISAVAMMAGMATTTGCTGSSDDTSRPNILLLMTDQQQMPPAGYKPNEGLLDGMKEILGFRPLSAGNPYTNFFPGFMRLRQNAVIMRTHYTASSACVPSRTCIMTGSYTTGVTQTDGLFKSAETVNWLDPEGPPTIGDWMRACGYSTHYFGKWHVSDPKAPDYLEPWGFADWEKSSPEPHGSDPYNLGVYRDVGFVESVEEFLGGEGKTSSRPWFAVGSLVNPHDVGAWPVSWQKPQDQGVVPWTKYPPPPPNPIQGQASLPNPDSLTVPLNPDGFPQDNCTLPSTYDETLADKPRCQKDYSLKYGLAFDAVYNYNKLPSPYPFQMQGDEARDWSLAFDQFYFYCMYLADLQLRKMLQTLDENGLTGNTIIIFLSDHGEMGGAHGGMIQKWHNAYEEAIHVPMVVSSPLVNPEAGSMRDIVQPTSSIDFAPTVLGLAGFDQTSIRLGLEKILGRVVQPFVGADLSAHIKGETSEPICGPDGSPRPGVLFATSDAITEIGPDPDPETQEKYDMFLDNVKKAKAEGYVEEEGPVLQPNNVAALCTGDWKIARYADPNGVKSDEWELYCLNTDPVERKNLLDYRTGHVLPDASVDGMSHAELVAKAAWLQTELDKQQGQLLGGSWPT
ncbi:MAG: DUF229 domain-containing protein [Deltaproteobacteria bacterium]|nr:DUF229 domain-containing protein [Deltaproteobacteria bacterium]